MFVVIVGGFSVIASAQATRTWVSGVGDDANPCSRTAPCKTFQGAIAKTATGGEIDVLDPGGFGAVTITKSISIEADPFMGGVLVSGTNGIVVNTPAGSNVTLRGITFEGLGTGLDGILFNGGGELHVEHCSIHAFTSNGIEFTPSAAGQSYLFVNDTIIKDVSGTGGTNPTGGILINPQTGANVVASIDNSRIEKNLIGLKVNDNSKATINRSIISGNTGKGITVNSTSAAASIHIEACILAFNGTTAIAAIGALATATIYDDTVTANRVGLQTGGPGNGSIVSYGQNKVYGNTSVDGAPTSTVAPI